MLYVTKSGRLTTYSSSESFLENTDKRKFPYIGFKVSQSEMMKLLDIDRQTILNIMETFRIWAGYYPIQSKRQEKDFEHFVNYAMSRNLKAQLQAAFILDEAFKMQKNDQSKNESRN